MRTPPRPIRPKLENQVAVVTVDVVGPLVRSLPARCVGRVARKTVIAVIGSTILASGVALLVLPGPATLVIPLGLMVLATEFSWAAKFLRHLGTHARRLKTGIRQGLRKRSRIARSRARV